MGRFHRFLENQYIKLVAPSAEVADGIVPSTWLDVSNFERFVFLIEVGATDDTSITAQVRQATSSGGANAKDVTGAAITGTILAGSNDNKWAAIEVENAHLDLNGGNFKYVALNLAAAGGTATLGSVWFFGINPRSAPVIQPAECAELVYVDG